MMKIQKKLHFRKLETFHEMIFLSFWLKMNWQIFWRYMKLLFSIYFNLFFNQSKLAALSGVRFTKMRNSSNEMEVFFESIAIINNKPKGHLTNSNNLLKMRNVSIEFFLLSGLNFLFSNPILLRVSARLAKTSAKLRIRVRIGKYIFDHLK